MALRAKKLFVWSFAACVPLALTARADVIESTPADPFSSAAIDHAAQAKSPEAIVPETGPADEEFKSLPTEVIHERYPSRAVKVERHVIQDRSGNYVNHGRWTMSTNKGTRSPMAIIAMASAMESGRGGTSRAARTCLQLPYKSFQVPFVSEVMFDNGRMHGMWTIYDSKDRKCSEFAFEHDEREGKSTWYYPNGERCARSTSRSANSTDIGWNGVPNKNVTKNESYQNGRGLAKKVEMHKGGKVKKARAPTCWPARC